MKRIFVALAALAVVGLARADTAVTHGDWVLYRGSSILQRGFADEASCVTAADALDARTYTCRTITTVVVTHPVVTPPPPPPPPPSGFPDATNTGVPAGITLAPYTGPQTITAANTVIDSKLITKCPLSIATTGVLIKNSQIQCNGSFGITVDDKAMYAATSSATVFAVTLQDSEISCGSTASGVGMTGISEADVHLVRAHLHGCENGFDINQNVLVEDSFIHDLAATSSSHSDGMQMACGHWVQGYKGTACDSSYAPGAFNVTIRHSTIFGMSHGDTAFETSAIITNTGAWQPDTNVTIEGNQLAGGAYTLYCNPNGGVNFRVTNNVFSRQFGPNVGFYGPLSDCTRIAEFSGNKYDDGTAVPQQ